MLYAVILGFAMLSLIFQMGIILSVVMLSILMLSVIILSVAGAIVAAPSFKLQIKKQNKQRLHFIATLD